MGNCCFAAQIRQGNSVIEVSLLSMCKRFDRSCIFNGRYGSILPSLYTGMRSLTLPQEKRVVFPSETLTAGAETRSNEGIPPLRMPHRNFCAHAVMQKRKKNQWSCVLLQAMVRNAEVRFVFRGEDKGVRSGSWHVRPGSEGRARAVFARAQCS